MTSNPPRPSRLDPVIEVLLIALLAFMPAAFGAVAAWSEAVALALGAAVALCLAVRALAAPSHELRPSLAWVGVVLFIAIAAAQLLPLPMSVVRAVSPPTAALKTDLLEDLPDAKEVLAHETLSFYPRGTREELRVVLLATTVFAAVVTLYRDDRRLRRLLAAVALIGGAFALLALAQDVTRTTRIYWRVPLDELARSGPFANHSHYAQFMNLSVGCALALLLVRLTDAHRVSFWQLARRTWWLAAIIVLGLATVSLSLSRGGTIAMIASAVVATAVLLASRSLRQMAGVVVALLLAALAFVFYHGFDRVYARMIQPGMGARVQMVRDTLEMARAFPTVGVGLGAYEWIFPTYDRSFSSSTAEYVENEYVQALADTGPLGLAAVLLFVGVIAARYLKAVRNHEDERIGLAAVGLGYGLVAVMVHSLSDFGQHLPAIACLSAATCGLLFNLGHRRGARTIRVGRGFGVVVLLLVAVTATWALAGAAGAWRGEQHWERASRLAARMGRQDWQGSDQQFDALLTAASNAVRADPDNAHYRYYLAAYRWYWISNQTDEKTGAVVVNDRTVSAAQRVIGELNDARERCPTFGLVYTLLGQVELRFLDRPIGYSHIESGYRLSRNDADAAFVAGQADAVRGDFGLARLKFQEAIRINRDVVDDVIGVYLYEAHRPELAAEGLGEDYFALMRLRDHLRLNEQWKDLAVRAEDRAFAVLARECDAPDAPAWKVSHVGAYYQDRQRYELADHYLSRALTMQPQTLDWLVRRAEVRHKLGRTAEAIADAQLALQLHPDAPEARAAIRIVTGAGATP